MSNGRSSTIMLISKIMLISFKGLLQSWNLERVEII